MMAPGPRLTNGQSFHWCRQVFRADGKTDLPRNPEEDRMSVSGLPTTASAQSDPIVSLRHVQELLALQADLVRKFGVERDLLPQGDGPRLRVGLCVVHGHPDFEVPVVGPADPLGHRGCFRYHATVPVDPDVVAEAFRGDDEGVALPGG